MNKLLKKITFLLFHLLVSNCISAIAQDTNKIFIASSVGVLLPVSNFANAYKQSLALNSGIEFKGKHNYFVQAVIDFNAVMYSQQIKDVNSNYLFQKTMSSVLLLGANVGRSFAITQKSNIEFAPYAGFGYANIGEPRLMIDNANAIITQSVTRMQGVFVRPGLRLLYNSRSKFLKTIFLDSSYWLSTIKVQQSTAQAFSLLIGTKIGI